MKILLSALPRTGSKWLCKNLHLYLKARFNFAAELYVNDAYNTKLPITDWFTSDGEKMVFDGHIKPFVYNFKLVPDQLSLTDEIYHRLKLLEEYNQHMVIKIHPVVLREAIAISVLQNIVDKHYILKRRETFDQCISIIACNHTNLWSMSQRLKDKIAQLKENPYTIPIDRFNVAWQNLNTRIKWLDTLPNSQTLYYEDLIKIKNDLDFCIWLNLPYYQFDLSMSFGIEYGDDKKSIISNYDDLKAHFDTLAA